MEEEGIISLTYDQQIILQSKIACFMMVANQCSHASSRLFNELGLEPLVSRQSTCSCVTALQDSNYLNADYIRRRLQHSIERRKEGLKRSCGQT